MRHIRSSSAQLGILLLARLAFDLDFQSIILYFSTFSTSFNVEVWLMGFIISTYSIFILLSPIFGNLSDQYGRRKFLTSGLVIFALSSSLMVISQDWIQVLVARGLAGLSSAIFMPALLAELGDNYSYEKRSRAMGFVRLSWPITFIIGVPLVGYTIEYLNWRLPFIVLTVLAVSSGLLITLIEPSTDKSNDQKPTVKQSVNLFKIVLLDRSALSGLILSFFAVGAIQGILAFFSVWMETEFQIKESSVSVIYAFMGVGTLFGTLLATWIGDNIGPKKCVIVGLAIAAGCMILLSHFSFNTLFVMFWLILLGTAFDFSMTEVPVLLTQITPKSKGTVLSLNQALNAGATSLCAALSGVIWSNYGYTVIGLVFATMGFIGALIGYFNIRIKSESELIN
ncbi:MAG: MFS transporter [Promethearchaeota archaeon]